MSACQGRAAKGFLSYRTPLPCVHVLHPLRRGGAVSMRHCESVCDCQCAWLLAREFLVPTACPDNVAIQVGCEQLQAPGGSDHPQRVAAWRTEKQTDGSQKAESPEVLRTCFELYRWSTHRQESMSSRRHWACLRPRIRVRIVVLQASPMGTCVCFDCACCLDSQRTAWDGQTCRHLRCAGR